MYQSQQSEFYARVDGLFEVVIEGNDKATAKLCLGAAAYAGLNIDEGNLTYAEIEPCPEAQLDTQGGVETVVLKHIFQFRVESLQTKLAENAGIGYKAGVNLEEFRKQFLGLISMGVCTVSERYVLTPSDTTFNKT